MITRKYCILEKVYPNDVVALHKKMNAAQISLIKFLSNNCKSHTKIVMSAELYDLEEHIRCFREALGGN